MSLSLAALFRLAGAGFVLAREGAFAGVPLDDVPPGPPRTMLRLSRLLQRRRTEGEEERLTRAINRLGPSYVKLGQFLATRPDLVGAEVALTLGKLRDEIEPFPEDEAWETVARAFGKPVDVLFTAFSPPVAAASISQVHKAEMATEDGPLALNKADHNLVIVER